MRNGPGRKRPSNDCAIRSADFCKSTGRGRPLCLPALTPARKRVHANALSNKKSLLPYLRQEAFFVPRRPQPETVAGYIWHPSLQWDTGRILKRAVHIRQPSFLRIFRVKRILVLIVILPPPKVNHTHILLYISFYYP